MTRLKDFLDLVLVLAAFTVEPVDRVGSATVVAGMVGGQR